VLVAVSAAGRVAVQVDDLSGDRDRFVVRKDRKREEEKECDGELFCNARNVGPMVTGTPLEVR
jgi:hypothetical protein